jgi:o-succinylbenzoate synthase
VKRLQFRIDLRHPVMGVTERSGYLLEGPAGWGECSPLPSWNDADRAASERCALEAAMLPFPAQVRDRIAVNAMVPRLDPDVAAALALESGCATIKVKVGDDKSVDRVAAIRAACGPRIHIRLDANGAWDIDSALRMLERLRTYDIELVEDPVASLEELRAVRGRAGMPVAAESSIRTTADARRLHDLEAADVIVLKPQRIGGVREALRAAEASGVPAIASSALETSVGLAVVVALAASLPDAPFAHGAGTALLLAADVVSDPLVPVEGWLTPRRPQVDTGSLMPA